MTEQEAKVLFPCLFKGNKGNKGMKEDELRKYTTCDKCGNKIMQNGNLNFYRVTVKGYLINLGAVQRQDGFATMIGSSMLANVMGRNEDMAMQMSDKTVTICADCICEPIIPMALEEESDETV